MGRMRTFILVLGGMSLAGALSGCMSGGGQNGDNTRLDRQQQEIDQLKIQVAANADQLKKMSGSSTDSRSRMVDSAIFLAENGPDTITSQAISILGGIGGDKAEDALLRMLESKPNYNSNIVQALAAMRSKKLHDVVIGMLQNPDTNRLNTVANIISNQSFSVLVPTDVPILEKVLESLPDNDYNNNRNFRNGLTMAILRLAPEKGIQYVCNNLTVTTEPYRRNEIISRLGNQNVRLGIDEWKKIIECLGPISPANQDCYRSILHSIQRSGDWRYTDLILSWSDMAHTNRNLANEYMNTLLQLRDPKAAKTLVEFLKNKELSRNFTRNMADFPGIKQENGQYTLVAEAELEKLISNRNKIVERLNSKEKKQK